jgi:hypothetical protein
MKNAPSAKMKELLMTPQEMKKNLKGRNSLVDLLVCSLYGLKDLEKRRMPKTFFVTTDAFVEGSFLMSRKCDEDKHNGLS